ncbi:hypothetical protein PhaeoP128_00527 [Phaeobacter gallaeciensis]|nr:hypothetical protein PhaeoP129_00527 [Phaeobacter gallaeciensis]ATF21296.1 hypothetical protein PhaeoP128_00527 [Phaeobacter gallaeciensis]
MDVGKAITKAFLAIVIALALLPQFTSDGGWQLRGWALITSPPNEIGDTFAGVAGVLAFLWIIVTVWLQSQELAAQRQELAATRSELKLAREAQEQQVVVMKEQADVFRHEQRNRKELEAEKLFNEKMRSLIAEIKETGLKGTNWAFSNGPFIDEDIGFDGEVHGLSLDRYIDEDVTIDEAITKFRQRLSSMREALWDYLHQSFDYRLPARTDSILQIVKKLENIAAMRGDLSPSQQERLSRMRLSEISMALLELQETPELWKEAAQ